MAILVNSLLLALLAYLAIGLLFAVAFVTRGLARTDPAAAGSSWAFRLVILPGVAALWPIMAAKWARAPAQQGAEA